VFGVIITTMAAKTRRAPERESGSATRRAARAVEKSAGVSARVARVEAELSQIREVLRTSEIMVAAAKLRAMNEELAHRGIAGLRQKLSALQAAGVIDGKGNLLLKDLPEEMRDAPDAI
jgi:hypothetical protein